MSNLDNAKLFPLNKEEIFNAMNEPNTYNNRLYDLMSHIYGGGIASPNSCFDIIENNYRCVVRAHKFIFHPTCGGCIEAKNRNTKNGFTPNIVFGTVEVIPINSNNLQFTDADECIYAEKYTAHSEQTIANNFHLESESSDTSDSSSSTCSSDSSDSSDDDSSSYSDGDLVLPNRPNADNVDNVNNISEIYLYEDTEAITETITETIAEINIGVESTAIADEYHEFPDQKETNSCSESTSDSDDESEINGDAADLNTAITFNDDFSAVIAQAKRDSENIQQMNVDIQDTMRAVTSLANESFITSTIVRSQGETLSDIRCSLTSVQETNVDIADSMRLVKTDAASTKLDLYMLKLDFDNLVKENEVAKNNIINMYEAEIDGLKYQIQNMQQALADIAANHQHLHVTVVKNECIHNRMEDSMYMLEQRISQMEATKTLTDSVIAMLQKQVIKTRLEIRNGLLANQSTTSEANSVRSAQLSE